MAYGCHIDARLFQSSLDCLPGCLVDCMISIPTSISMPMPMSIHLDISIPMYIYIHIYHVLQEAGSRNVGYHFEP